LTIAYCDNIIPSMEKGPTYHTKIRNNYPTQGVVYMNTREIAGTDLTRIGPVIADATRIGTIDTLTSNIKKDKHDISTRRGRVTLGIAIAALPAILAGPIGAINIAKEQTITPDIIVEVGLTLIGIIAAKGLHMYLERLRKRTALLESQWDAVMSEQYPATCNFNPR
jgi:hypothetical protein